eukprot:458044-Amorphochlora_amoeboformis.AAC.3
MDMIPPAANTAALTMTRVHANARLWSSMNIQGITGVSAPIAKHRKDDNAAFHGLPRSSMSIPSTICA